MTAIVMGRGTGAMGRLAVCVSTRPTRGVEGGGEAYYVPGNCPLGTAPDWSQGSSAVIEWCPCANAPDLHIQYGWGADGQDFWMTYYPCVPVCTAASPATPWQMEQSQYYLLTRPRTRSHCSKKISRSTIFPLSVTPLSKAMSFNC